MKNKIVDFIIGEGHYNYALIHFDGTCPFMESTIECSSKCMRSREDCNSCIQEYNKSILKQAFEAGRTVVNYKMEWQETYSDNKTEAKYKTFEEWYNG